MTIELREHGELELGIEAGGKVHREFVLRPARLADTYQAAAVVPVPAGIGDSQAARVAYQMAIDDALILCQVTQLGTLAPAPAAAELAAWIDPDDMAILRQAAAELKKKLRASRSGSLRTDAPNTSSSAPVSS